MLEPMERSTKALYAHSFEGGAAFRMRSLLIGAMIVLTMTLLTFGTVTSTGVIGPNFLLGACVGRAVGQEMQAMGMSVHPGVYALMGSAGMLAGFCRMSMSATMITLEITNSMKLLMPVMMVVLVSKALADWLAESAIDMFLKLSKITVIQSELDEDETPLLRLLTVHDACTVEVQTLKRHESCGHVIATLARTEFGGFPIVAVPGYQLIGFILREQLLLALQDHYREAEVPGHVVDLMPYADEAPEVKHWNTPLAKAYRHFVAAGLRHICLVDETHTLHGILTRSDLALVSHPRSRDKALRALLVRKMNAVSRMEKASRDNDCSEAPTCEAESPSLPDM